MNRAKPSAAADGFVGFGECIWIRSLGSPVTPQPRATDCVREMRRSADLGRG